MVYHSDDGGYTVFSLLCMLQSSYELEVLHNGTALNKVWIPVDDYTVVVTMGTEGDKVTVSQPKAPVSSAVYLLLPTNTIRIC